MDNQSSPPGYGSRSLELAEWNSSIASRNYGMTLVLRAT